MKTCASCSKEFEGRGSVCGACRVKASREKKRADDLPTPGSDEWYTYGTPEDPDKTWDRNCVICGEKYTTNLSLKRFCSDECKKNVMIALANGPHKNFKL